MRFTRICVSQPERSTINAAYINVEENAASSDFFFQDCWSSGLSDFEVYLYWLIFFRDCMFCYIALHIHGNVKWSSIWKLNSIIAREHAWLCSMAHPWPRCSFKRWAKSAVFKRFWIRQATCLKFAFSILSNVRYAVCMRQRVQCMWSVITIIILHVVTRCVQEPMTAFTDCDGLTKLSK